jgi:U3 small nucleolar RNA-associated protein 21
MHAYIHIRMHTCIHTSRTPQSISALAAHGDYTYAGVGSDIYVYVRGKEVLRLTGHTGKVKLLTTFGQLLLSYGSDGVIITWNLTTHAEENRIVLKDAGIVSENNQNSPAKITAWMHPSTYLNKMVLGDAEGRMYVLNVRTGKCVYTFSSAGSEISTMCQSPAVDVIAVGTLDGRIMVKNIKFDESVMEFR